MVEQDHARYAEPGMWVHHSLQQPFPRGFGVAADYERQHQRQTVSQSPLRATIRLHTRRALPRPVALDLHF